MKAFSMGHWDDLARLLLRSAGDDVARRGRPLWVRVLDAPDGDPDEGFALAMSDEPEGLFGWEATADCQAVGMVATGRVQALPAARSAVGSAHAGQVRMACLVTRLGEIAWQVDRPAGTGSGAALNAPAEGRILDCLRRCFALPTPPPPETPGRLQDVVWLVAVLDRASRLPRRLNWSDVSRLHPVAQVLRTDLGERDAELSGLLRLAGSAWTWEELRQQTAQQALLPDLVDPAMAAWMDEGMFARWVMAELPDRDELLTAVRPHLAPSAARRLAHAVRAGSAADSAAAP
jgi:hypothetical protein